MNTLFAILCLLLVNDTIPSLTTDIDEPSDSLVLLTDSTGSSAEQLIDDSLSSELFDSVAPSFLNLVASSPLEVYDERLIDYVLSWLDTTDCIFQPDTTRYPDSVYIARLQALPCEMEMPYNRYVKAQIERYMHRAPKQVAMMQRLSEYYFPIFEQALHRYSLPQELKYLPVIESALNARAHSRMGAAGLWQFMVQTGKLNGLEINSLIDERYDPHKSTEAACKFLRSLYSIYHDWTLVIAAYNCGPGNVNKAIHRSGGKRDFWAIYDYLPRETRSYVPIFIAANYAMNYADEHRICKAAPMLLSTPTDTILTDKRLHLLQVATVLDIPLEDLRYLNPQYSKDILPGGRQYALVLPMDKTGSFIQMQDSVLSYKADSLINNRRAVIEMAQRTAVDGSYRSGNTIYYKVKKGDTLSGIAKRYHCSVSQLKKWNKLSSSNIMIGKTIKIKK